LIILTNVPIMWLLANLTLPRFGGQMLGNCVS
jgi:hypothetical protein